MTFNAASAASATDKYAAWSAVSPSPSSNRTNGDCMLENDLLHQGPLSPPLKAKTAGSGSSCCRSGKVVDAPDTYKRSLDAMSAKPAHLRRRCSLEDNT